MTEVQPGTCSPADFFSCPERSEGTLPSRRCAGKYENTGACSAARDPLLLKDLRCNSDPSLRFFPCPERSWQLAQLKPIDEVPLKGESS
jgi:hypothetical protein